MLTTSAAPVSASGQILFFFCILNKSSPSLRFSITHLSHNGLLTQSLTFSLGEQIGIGEFPPKSPVGTLFLLHGLFLSSWSAGPALDWSFSNLLPPVCRLPFPHPPSQSNRAPFSRSQLLGSSVCTDCTLTYFTFSVQFPLFTKPLFPHQLPRILFQSLLISPSRSYHTVKGGPPAFFQK